jgi:alginate O-acetyltransferase complex protein AlgI
MLYYTPEYILLFLPLTLFIYFSLSKAGIPALPNFSLLVSSFIFYGLWNIDSVPILCGSAIINFLFVRSIIATRRPSVSLGLLVTAISFNVFLLGYFKYTNFFIDNINALGFSVPHIAAFLPLGISFFTFQKIGLLIDAHNRRINCIRFTDYALFVSFFPQLIAGPIVHHSEIIPQLNSPKRPAFNINNFAKGLLLFSIGFFKKLFLADQLGGFADAGFADAKNLSSIDAWFCALAYTFQLYFDFSGYMDMGLGSALMFNIVLPINFNSPYKSTNIQDFWRRWHITLGRFLRNYVFIPLGGSHQTLARTSRNLFITFVLAGFWHGAAWTFVAWGAWHGIGLAVHRLFASLQVKLPKILSWGLTFTFVVFGWVIFRANSLDDAMEIMTKMCALPLDFISQPFSALYYSRKLATAWGISMIVASLAICLISANSNELIERYRPRPWHSLWVATMIVAGFIVATYSNAPPPFIYFNF